jgi:16S rRNA (guanine527-N7)-methyltransferase
MQKRPGNKDYSEPIEIPIEDVLDLHTFLPKEIPDLLEAYLTACRQAKIYSVRIIHGKGKGFQKNRVRSLLAKLPMVASFSDAPIGAGGWGATIVELKRESDALSREWSGFLKQVAKGARSMGMHLDQSQITQFALHAKELLEWNRFANLTAITDLEEMAEKLFLDTLPMEPLIPQDSRVLDIGSGGGFPGIPLKVLRPDLHMNLIEASRKKTHFLKHVIRTLGLKDIEARHIRAEELAKNAQARTTPYNVIVSKAASKLKKLLDQALPLLRIPGMIIAMKGISIEPELESVKGRIKAEDLTVDTKTYRLPGLGIKRTLIILYLGRS